MTLSNTIIVQNHTSALLTGRWLAVTIACVLVISACSSPSEDGDDASTDGTDTSTADGSTGTSGDDTGTGTGTGTDTDTDTDAPPCPYDPVTGSPEYGLEEVASGFSRPVLALGHPTEPGRMFVVEQTGSIKLLDEGETTSPESDFLTLDVNDGPNEAGLLGLALHPNFPEDPRVYVNYNPAGGALRTRVEEYTLDPANPDVADPSSARVLLEIGQPASNHNGGMLAFGPDHMLYIGMGDGGGSCDSAASSSRDPGDLLAKILRIDVEPAGGMPYGVPADNPFVNDGEFAPEIFAWGLRNPWRFAFDGDTLYVADVGQDDWEEVDVVEGGHDYGWSTMEGGHCSADTECSGATCDDSPGPGQTNADGMTLPIAEYQNDGQRCSISGGSVYRACEVPAWQGIYFYADYCSGEVFGLRWDGSQVQDLGVLIMSGQRVQGNGWNAHGDVLFTTVINELSSTGSVFRIAPAS